MSNGIAISCKKFINKEKMMKFICKYQIEAVQYKGKPIIVSAILIDEEKNCITIPRTIFYKEFPQLCKDKYIVDCDVDYLSSLPLYDYQMEAILYATEYDQFIKTGVIYLQMDTGLGKTRMGVAFAQLIGMKTFIVVPTIAIRDQWIEEISNLFPNEKIGIHTTKCNKDFSRVRYVVSVIASARNIDTELLSQFGTVLLDEAHEYCSKENVNILRKAHVAKYIIGLSATPDNVVAGIEPIVKKILGDPVYLAEITNLEMSFFTCEVSVIKNEASYDFEDVGSFADCIKVLEYNDERTELVIEQVMKLYEENHNIMVFCEHRDYVDILYEKLYKRTNTIAPESASYLYGGSNKSDIENAGCKKVVILTYGYGRRGLSFVNMTALVMATPRKNNMAQIIGRITRKGSDENIIRKIIDIWDVNSMFVGQFNTRKKAYKIKKINYYIQ